MFFPLPPAHSRQGFAQGSKEHFRASSRDGKCRALLGAVGLGAPGLNLGAPMSLLGLPAPAPLCSARLSVLSVLDAKQHHLGTAELPAWSHRCPLVPQFPQLGRVLLSAPRLPRWLVRGLCSHEHRSWCCCSWSARMVLGRLG